MPGNKNQHYVPKCHLKPFTVGEEGAAIHLYNHPRALVVYGASVSDQCSKAYFYGKNLDVEMQLQTLEGIYAAVVRRVQAGTELDRDDLDFLRSFVHLQWLRTDGALRRRREILETMKELAEHGLEGRHAEGVDLSHEALVLGSLSAWAKTHAKIADLKVAVVYNGSRVPFITSDDPAILTNRVYLQRLSDPNFGLASAGAIMLMPLTPWHAILCYDSTSYAPPLRNGYRLDLGRDRDAAFVNQFQCLNSIANLYFAGAEAEARATSAAFDLVMHLRPNSRFTFWQGVSEGIEGGFERFRRLRSGERPEAGAVRIQSFSPIYPQPLYWPKFLPMRTNLTGWHVPGTVGGPVRAALAKDVFQMREVALGFRPLAPRGGNLPDVMFHRVGADELRRRGLLSPGAIDRPAPSSLPNAIAKRLDRGG